MEFLNSVIVDMQRKNDTLKAKLEIFENAGILGTSLFFSLFIPKITVDPDPLEGMRIRIGKVKNNHNKILTTRSLLASLDPDSWCGS